MLILASQSASRKYILESIGYMCTCVPSHAEEIFDATQSPEENAMRLALIKAKTVAQQFPNHLVIGSDTIQIDPNGKWLEKPRDEHDARAMMQNRSGKSERLISGIAMVCPEGQKTMYETTTLHWKTMTQAEQNHIIQTGEWQGKCGGIAIEGVSGLFITALEGSIANVMGFPLNAFWEMIASQPFSQYSTKK